MASNEELVLIAMLLLEEDEDDEDVKEKKRIWSRPWLLERNTKGHFSQLLPDLAAHDTPGFENFMRMDFEHFKKLLDVLSETLNKKDTVMRESIKPAEMCCLTIRYLATGESFHSLEYQFRISRHSISKIVMSVCKALYEVMGPQYLTTPKTQEDWLQLSSKFEARWNFPNALGAVDGKRILLEQPRKSGSHYHDYKGNDSIILMAVIGPEYEFIFADVGMNGRMSDGGNWSRNEFRAALADVDNPLSIPSPKPLPGRTKPIPYVCVIGDDAFGLTSYMMKPYANTGLTEQKRVFNYRLSRCRRISENAFGILANRWRVFRGYMLLPPDKATIVTLGAITLHNFLRSSSDAGKVYIPPGFADQQDPVTGEVIPGMWRNSGEASSWERFRPLRSYNPTFEAKEIRQEYTNYFMMEGAVAWQWKSAHVDQ